MAGPRLVTSANAMTLRDVVPGAQAQTTLTLASGAATPVYGHHVIAAESGTADDFDTVTLTSLRAGDVVEWTVDAGDTITFTSGVGNITTSTGRSIIAAAGQTVRTKVNAAGDGVVATLIGDDEAAFESGGTIAADGNNEITVQHGYRYQLTASDSIAGVIGLADGEFCQVIAPSSGSATLEDEGTTTAGLALKLSGSDLAIAAADETIYTLARVGSNIHVSGGGGVTATDLASTANGKGASLVGVEDDGGYYAGSNVEAILQDIGARITREFWIDDPAYGAVGDAIRHNDGVATNADATFTCASANFVAADIGKAISIYKGKASGSTGPSGVADSYAVWHHTTIASINSTTSIELTAAPTASASLTWFVYGTDDQAAKTAAVTAINAAGGGRLVFTPGKNYYLGNNEDQFTTGNVHILATGATIYCPALTNNDLVTQSPGADWLFSTPGKAYEGASDGANLAATTTLSADAVRGTTSITVASATGIRIGQYVDINSTEAFTSASSRGLFDRNRVSAINGTTIHLENEVPMTLSVSGETVTAKFYTMLENFIVEGGEWVAGGYAGDAGNGGGQSGFYIQYFKNVLIKDAYFDGFMGFPVYPQFCIDVLYDGGGHTGRPGDIVYIEDQVSGWYWGYSQQCRNVTVINSTTRRCRHHIDGGYCVGLHAYHNDVFYSRTSAFRTHNGVVDYDFSYNRLHQCSTGISHSGTRGRNNHNVGTVWGYFLLQDGGAVTYAFDGEIETIGNKIRQVANPDSLSGDYPVVNLTGPFASNICNRNHFVQLGDQDGIVMQPTASGEYNTYLEVCDNLIESNSTGDPGILLGNSGKVLCTTGLVARNRVSCPGANVIQIAGPASGSLDDFYVVDNYCPDATKTATDLVTESGNFGSNYYEGENYGPAFGTTPAGGSTPGAWTVSTVSPTFATPDDAVWNATGNGARWRWQKNGTIVTFSLSLTGNISWSGSPSGNFRVPTPFTPSVQTTGEAVFNGVSTFTFPSGATYLTGVLQTGGYFEIRSCGSAHATATVGASHITSGNALFFAAKGTQEVAA